MIKSAKQNAQTPKRNINIYIYIFFFFEEMKGLYSLDERWKHQKENWNKNENENNWKKEKKGKRNLVLWCVFSFLPNTF